MALTNAFKEAVQTGNVPLVRITMKNSLLVDPTFKDFDEMEDYVKRSGLKINENCNGENFINDKKFWNDDYMNSQFVELVSNFCPERIKHLKEVVRYLRPIKDSTLPKIDKANQSELPLSERNTATHGAPTATGNSDAHRKYDVRIEQTPDNRGAKISIGAIGGAIVGGVVTAAAKAAVGGIIAGVAIGGIIGGFIAAALTSGSRR